jgi:hypothetical protein
MATRRLRTRHNPSTLADLRPRPYREIPAGYDHPWFAAVTVIAESARPVPPARVAAAASGSTPSSCGHIPDGNGAEPAVHGTAWLGCFWGQEVSVRSARCELLRAEQGL